MSSRFAYVTTLTSVSYIPGVIALKKSLQKAKSRFGLIVLIPESCCESLTKIIHINKLADQYCRCVVKPDLVFKNKKSHYWDYTFFKLTAASMTEYDKIILIDSDMLINKNIDHLFECESFSAVIAGKAAHTEYEQLNSGLIVLKPSSTLFEGLVSCAYTAIQKREIRGLFAGDQDVFIEYKTGWENDSTLHLSENYNCFYDDVYRVSKSTNIRAKEIDVIHFIGKEKPWMKDKCLSYYLWLIKNRRFAQYRFFSKYKKMCRCKYE